MTVTKRQLSNALVKFIGEDLIPQVGDRNMKFVLAMAKDSLHENPDLIDDFLKSPMISAVVHEDDDGYDLSHFSIILKKVLTEYQSFPVTIPKIPLFSPSEKVLKITADDVDKLMKYIAPSDSMAV